MSKHITGEITCECGKKVRWLRFHYADVFNDEKPEWREEDGRIEVG